MSTAQQAREVKVPQIYDGSVAKSTSVAGFTGIDPRRRRFGYHPGIYRMEVESRHSGQQLRIIPGGILVPFRSADLAAENFDINVQIDEYRKQVAREFTAKWFIDNCKVNYDSQGFREIEPLTLLDDAIREEDGRIRFENFLASPHGYFNQIHPSFAEISHICPADLVNCATCRVSLLGGDDTEFGIPAVIQERMAKLPDQGIAELLRQVLLDANVAYRDYCTQKWQVLMGEYEGRQKGEPGIGRLDDSLHHVRKHIHEVAPAERTALAAAGYGDRVAEAQAEGMKGLADAFRESAPKGDNSELIAMLMEDRKQNAKLLRQQGELLAQIGERLAGHVEPPPVAPQVEEQAPVEAPETAPEES